MSKPTPLSAHEELQDAFAADVKSIANQESPGRIFATSWRDLSKLKTVELRTLVSRLICRKISSFVETPRATRLVFFGLI